MRRGSPRVWLTLAVRLTALVDVADVSDGLPHKAHLAVSAALAVVGATHAVGLTKLQF